MHTNLYTKCGICDFPIHVYLCSVVYLYVAVCCCLHAGRDVDVLARRALWSVGWNYRHGTGHGLGMFLNVHEGYYMLIYTLIRWPNG